jgi:arylsulfatase A-like enzyme
MVVKYYKFLMGGYCKCHTLLAALILSCFCFSGRAQHQKVASQSKPPNILFFLVDDLGWTDVGSFGSDFYETPNINKLASESVKFTNAYSACPVCSPSRASILTGKYPVEIGTTDWIGAAQPADALKESRADRIKRLLPAEYKPYLPAEETTIAEALKRGGYTTFGAGKWHLGNDSIHMPTQQGFDVYYQGDARRPSKDVFDLAEQTNRFIGENKDKSFFALLSFYSVHIPINAGQETIEKYRIKRNKLGADNEFVKDSSTKVRTIQRNITYAAMVEEMDRAVGLVLDKLKELKIDDNTVIIFFSDNGGVSTAEGWPTANNPLRAGKGWLYEGGIRVPMLIKWPTVTRSGFVIETPVIGNDFYPTLLNIAKMPLTPKQHTGGVNLVPLLKNNQLTQRDLYWHYPHYGNQGGSPGSAIREGKWKLIHWYENDRYELFNLESDLGEKKNLLNSNAAKADYLKKKLGAWLKKENALYPILNPNYKHG